MVSEALKKEEFLDKMFSTFDIGKILGLQRTRVHEWIISGYIFPTVKARGKGTKAQFTVDDLYRVHAFQRLVEVGLQRDLAKEYTASLTFKNVGEAKDKIKYSVSAKGVVPGLPKGRMGRTGGETLVYEPPTIEFREHEFLVYVINLLQIKKEVDERLLKYKNKK